MEAGLVAPTTRREDDMIAGLRQNIYRLLESDRQLGVFALLDQNCPVPQDHPLHPQALVNREVRADLCPVNRRDRADDPEICPQLLTLRPAGANGYVDEGLFDLLLACAQERAASANGSYVAGWLLASVDPQAIAGHLERATVMLDLAQGKQRVLPFFEPHRLALLHAADDKAPRGIVSQLLGPIAHWFYIDAIGQLHCASRTTSAMAGAGKLSLSDWQRQARIPAIRMVLLALGRSETTVPLRPEFRIDQTIATAHGLGFTELEDLVFFSLNSFTVGHDWHEHPIAATTIRRSLADGVPLVECMQELSDDDLNLIAAQR